MGDYIVRAMAANQQIRAFAITSRELVEKARESHNTSPVATAAQKKHIPALLPSSARRTRAKVLC